MSGSFRGAILFFLGVTLCACSTPSPQSLAEHDPWEKTNRDIFTFDVWVEKHIGHPVDDVYRAVLPEPARKGIHNVPSPGSQERKNLQRTAEVIRCEPFSATSRC